MLVLYPSTVFCPFVRRRKHTIALLYAFALLACLLDLLQQILISTTVSLVTTTLFRLLYSTGLTDSTSLKYSIVVECIYYIYIE